MTYRITLSHQARRAIEFELPEAVAGACVEFLVTVLAGNPRRVGTKLRPPLYPFYVARRGEFRVIYDVDDDRVIVHVVSIRHRRDVYRMR